MPTDLTVGGGAVGGLLRTGEPGSSPQPERVTFPAWLERAVGYSWRALVIGLAVLVGGFVLLELRLVVVPVLIALFVATLLLPPVQWLRQRGWHPMLATWVVLLGALGLLVGLGFALAPSLSDEFRELGPRLTEAREDIEDWLVEGPLGLSRQQIDNAVDQATDRISEDSSVLTSNLAAAGVLAFEFVAGALIALVLAFFFIKDSEKFTRWFISHTAERHQEVVRAMGRRAWATLAAYVRGVAIVGLVNAAALSIGLLVIGVPLVLPLAVLTFFGAFFPLVGAVVAGTLAALVALVSGGLVDALLVAGLVIIVQQVEGDVISPLVMGRALKLHPAVIIVVLTAGAVIAGLLGAFLAVPLTAVAVAAGSEVRASIRRG